MKKLLIVLFVVTLAFGVILAACGGSESESSTTSPSANQEPTTSTAPSEGPTTSTSASEGPAAPAYGGTLRVINAGLFRQSLAGHLG